MTVDSSIWSTLVDLNKAADSLIARARKRIEPSPPVSRELLTNASVEVRFNNLASYSAASVVKPNSDSLWGNNVKKGIWTNGASRLYLRDVAFDHFYVRAPNTNSRFYGNLPFYPNIIPPYVRWNFQTSITQKQYADKRVSLFSGGRREAGNHLSFKDPLVIEPMETLTFEAELLSFGDSTVNLVNLIDGFVLSFYLSGYREGM